MANYARVLLAGDRAGIAALYDPDGAILVRNGRKEIVDSEQVAARYAGANWQPPARFTWPELHFEAVGPDSVVVLGTFAWGKADGSTIDGTYHSVLRRDGDRLVIRIEDEAVGSAR